MANLAGSFCCVAVCEAAKYCGKHNNSGRDGFGQNANNFLLYACDDIKLGLLPALFWPGLGLAL